MCHRKFWNKSSENVYLKCQGMNLEERQDWNVPCISYSNVPHWSVSSWRERGKREVWRGKGTLQGSVSHGKQLKLTKKKEKKENAQHSLPSPSLPLGRTGQEILFWKWSETWSGAIGKMGDRSRRNKVGRPRYPHTKECRLFADNSPEIMSGIL